MKCSICGKEINRGYNPYPLCNELVNVLCCEECNQKYVLTARNFVLHGDYLLYNDAYIQNKFYDRIHTGMELLVLLKADEKTQEEFILKKGVITDIKDNLLYGTWGNFPVDMKKDKFAVFED